MKVNELINEQMDKTNSDGDKYDKNTKTVMEWSMRDRGECSLCQHRCLREIHLGSSLSIDRHDKKEPESGAEHGASKCKGAWHEPGQGQGQRQGQCGCCVTEKGPVTSDEIKEEGGTTSCRNIRSQRSWEGLRILSEV